MNNTDRHPKCHMRTALGNCDPIGGFCTSVNESVCEALHKVSRPQGEWIEKAISIIDDMQREGIIDYEQAREYRMRARMKGADDE